MFRSFWFESFIACELKTSLQADLITLHVKRGVKQRGIISWKACDSFVGGCGMRWISHELFLCSDFDRAGRAAGSEEDEQLATHIYDVFKKQSMEPWTDEHYVQLQTPNRFDANTLSSGC